MATGRAANTEEIGLETTKVELERGFVKVDGWMRTAEPHVYAHRRPDRGLMLAHVAAHEGIVAALLGVPGEAPEPIDYNHQPRATYTHPQVASIGLTEQQCDERGIAIKKGVFNFAAIAKAVIVGETEGFTKVIADATTDEVLGIAYDRPAVTDLIAEAALGMTLEATAWEIGAATHPHPDAGRGNGRGRHGRRGPPDQLLAPGRLALGYSPPLRRPEIGLPVAQVFEQHSLGVPGHAPHDRDVADAIRAKLTVNGRIR